MAGGSAVAEDQGCVGQGADGPLVGGARNRGGGKQRAVGAVGGVGVLRPGTAVPAQDHALHHAAVDAGNVVPDRIDVAGSAGGHAGETGISARRRARDDAPLGAVPLLDQRAAPGAEVAPMSSPTAQASVAEMAVTAAIVGVLVPGCCI